MSNYLSQIAKRNAPDHTPFLIPAMPLAKLKEDDPFEQSNGDQPLSDFVQQGNPFAANGAEPIVPGEMKREEVRLLQTRSSDTPYITRHVERLKSGENNDQWAASPAENVLNHMITGAHSSREVKDNSSAGEGDTATKPILIPAENEDPLEEKRTIKPFVDLNNPAYRNSAFDKKTEVFRPAERAPHTKLHPTDPIPSQLPERNKRPVPKLVIGKILVEVIQAEKATSPKIINHVVQAPSNPNGSKTNKLSFGLGQL